VVWEMTGVAMATSRQAKPKSGMPFVPERIHEPPKRMVLLVRQLYHRIGSDVKN
jgi:hypothetical protein